MVWEIINTNFTSSEDVNAEFVLNNNKLSIPQQFIINNVQKRIHEGLVDFAVALKDRGIDLNEKENNG